MRVQHVDNLTDLHVYHEKWDRLAGDCVFRSWSWLSTWWKHYGPATPSERRWGVDRELFVLLVPNSSASPANELIGVLPCYLETTPSRGRVLRLLGDGEVCSEYLDLLCQAEDTPAVIDALKEYLQSHAADWDGWEISTLDPTRTRLSEMVARLRDHHGSVRSRAGHRCWSLELPADWDSYLARLSKSHRKQLRQLTTRVLESGAAQWHLVTEQSEFEPAWKILQDLHQRRRQSLGEPGCFASPRWAAFHRDIASQLLARNQLRLSTLSVKGRPIAAEYQLVGGKSLYAYQGGLDPDFAELEPGRLSMIGSLQQAIQEELTEFDLLRGDEPYKPHWRAEPRTTLNLQIIAPRLSARCRHLSWRGLRTAGRVLHQFAGWLS